MPVVPSSDLERARVAARRLARRAREPGPSADRESLVPVSYASFGSVAPERGQPSFRPTNPYLQETPPPLPLELEGGEGYGAGRWARLLDWMAAVAAGELAFVMNGDGLTVASRGFESESTVDELGTRLMIAVEQANLMGLDTTDVRSLCIRFDGQWLSGVSVCQAGRPSLTAGVLALERLPDAAVQSAAKVLRARLGSAPSPGG